MNEKLIQYPSPSITASPSLANRHWCSHLFRTCFESILANEKTESDSTSKSKMRVQDFTFSPCRVVARISDDLGKPKRVELLFRRLTDEQWEKVITHLGNEAFFFARMLCNELPIEIVELLKVEGFSLVPQTAKDFQLRIDGKRVETHNPIAVSIVERLCEKVDEDPFVVFMLRGRTRDDLFALIREHRRAMAPVAEADEIATETGKNVDVAPTNTADAIPLERFWAPREELFAVGYSIRADELPAALLKWVDPLPLAGLEEDVEPLLEEAYAHIARRAQVFGLGL